MAQPADLRFGHVQLAGVAQQEQQIGGSFAILGVLVPIHFGQNLQGGLRQLHDPHERSCTRFPPTDLEQARVTGSAQLIQQVLLRPGQRLDLAIFEDAQRSHLSQ